MSSRNRSKASAGAHGKLAQQAKQAPAKPSSLPKPAPPPPKQTPSSRLRQEWKTFEIWLKARREEKDKQVSERINEIITPKGRGRFQKPAPPSGSMDIREFEAALEEKLAEKARAEWVRRLDAAGLNEEDWTDITPDEMQAVEAAFVPPEHPPDDSIPGAPNGATSMAFQDPSSTYNDREQWFPSVPGSWGAPQMTSARPSASRMQQTQSVPERTPYTSILNDKKIKPETSSMPTPELLWEMHMANKPGSEESVPSSNKPTPSSMRKTASGARGGYPPSPLSPTATKSNAESLWEMRTSKLSTSSPSQGPTAEESVKDRRMPKKVAAEQPLTPPESPWVTNATNKGGAMFTNQKKPSVSAADKADSLWNMYAATSASDHPSPITPTEPHDDSSAVTYVYLSPVLVDLEEEEPSNLELLPEKTVEAAIKQFHQMAAEADIELRRKLLKGNVDARQHDELLEEHLRTMELRCRAVVDEWKTAREAEKLKRLAEEKKKQTELEKKKQAETKKQATNGKWSASASAKAALPKVKSPEPQAKKGQAKANGNQKMRKVTVEEVPDVDQSETTSFAGSEMASDSLITDPEDTPTTARPAKNVPTNFMSSVWGKSSGSRTSSPAPVKRPPQEQKKPPVATKNPFAPQVSAPAPAPVPAPVLPASTQSPWESLFSRGTPSVQEQGRLQSQSLWGERYSVPEEEEEEEEEEEPPSLWQTATSEANRAATAAWSYATSTIAGERTATPAKPTRGGFDFSNEAAIRNAWLSEDTMHRSKSRGPFADENVAPAKDPRHQMWVPGARGDTDGDAVDSPMKKMADLALQNLYNVTEDESEPAELMEAMSIYTKAASSSNRKRGPGGRR